MTPKPDWTVIVRGALPDAAFRAPATAVAIADAGQRLGAAPPPDLASLLDQTDGVVADYGSALVWSVAELVARNVEMRTTADFAELYMPFDCLLFFGEGGNGDLYDYAIRAGQVRTEDIYAWDHETDGRVWVAGRLQQFIERGRREWLGR